MHLGVPVFSLCPSHHKAGWHSHGVHLCGLLLHAHPGAVCCSHLLCYMAGESDGMKLSIFTQILKCNVLSSNYCLPTHLVLCKLHAALHPAFECAALFSLKFGFYSFRF